MGLEILYPKPGDAEPDPFVVDIVAVHGLNGDPTDTWKPSSSKDFWLRDFLPFDVKGARVMTYGYNADVVFGNTTADVWDHAKSLLGSLIDERESEEESKRPLIFICHSLGGIIVKQALVWAHREPRYRAIKDHTLGIVFFGTPHRGSGKANYGKILANVAAGVMHKPKSKLIDALQSNSDTLMRLTSEFKFEAPNIEIMTFYETKSMSMFSGLIVDKYSALLELSHEDTQSVDAHHSDMCKIATRNDETYKKLVKRVARMLREKNKEVPASGSLSPERRNKYYELPFDVSPDFTGGNEVCRKLRESCLPSGHSTARVSQRRFTLWGLGGSGKTQMGLKFASDHRESFWGIFFIDTSSADMAEQGFSKMAKICKVGESLEDFKRYLANSPEPWLLILDNADDPFLNIAKFFPVGSRGTIIITSRNPECRVHATVGSTELREMESDDAITLLLKSAELSVDDENLRGHAKPIVQTLGFLALAVSQAAASIRQRVCSLEDYLDTFTHHRTVLLSRESVQSSSDYRHSVYTTWEVSVDAIKDLAKDPTNRLAATALEFLTFFGFCHFDNITERIFRSAWDNFDRIEQYQWWASNQLGMIRDRQSSNWDSLRFNEAMQLLSSYSLIRVSGPDMPISLHPLVHSWIRDSLNEELRLRWWNVALSTLALANDRFSYDSQLQLKVHLRHCMGVGQIDDFLIEDDVGLDRLKTVISIAELYREHSWRDALIFFERGLEYSKKIVGDECYETCLLSCWRAHGFNDFGEYQKTLDLLHGMVDVSIRVAGPADVLTLKIIDELASANKYLGRKQESVELNQKIIALWEKSLDSSDDVIIEGHFDIAMAYADLGRYEDAIEMLEREKNKERFHENPAVVWRRGIYLSHMYAMSGQHQAALDSSHSNLEDAEKVFGEHHPYTQWTAVSIAANYSGVGQPEKGIPLIVKALEVGSKIGLDDTQRAHPSITQKGQSPKNNHVRRLKGSQAAKGRDSGKDFDIELANLLSKKREVAKPFRFTRDEASRLLAFFLTTVVLGLE
ncbi:hypothetical protein BDR22DRAFT_892704 [Usnea florida]